MRKLTILLALAAVTATSGGCAGCIGRCRNLFHRGSPCGTNIAPAVLGAPLAMGTPVSQPAPMMSAPMMTAPMAAPMVMNPGVCCEPCIPCVPCDPCDPCGSGSMTMGYGGDCCDGGAVMTTPVPSGTYIPGGTGTIMPTPGLE